MTIYCIDDGGDGSQTNSTQSASTLDWSKADTSIANLISYDAAALTTSGNIIYFGHDHAGSQSGAWTLSGPTSGAPVVFISADRTTSTPTYLKSQTLQIENTTSGELTLDGAFAMYGRRLKAFGYLTLGNDYDEPIYLEDCDLALSANYSVYVGNTTGTAGRRSSRRRAPSRTSASCGASTPFSTTPPCGRFSSGNTSRPRSTGARSRST